MSTLCARDFIYEMNFRVSDIVGPKVQQGAGYTGAA